MSPGHPNYGFNEITLTEFMVLLAYMQAPYTTGHLNRLLHLSRDAVHYFLLLMIISGFSVASCLLMSSTHSP